MAKNQKKLTQRDLNSLETRGKIFSTALLLFAKKGYDKVTVEDITKYAGLSKGSFYTHFPTKDAILVEQFHKIDDHYEKTFKNIPDDMSATDRLMEIVSAMGDYCQRVCGVNVMKIVYMNQISLGPRSWILNDRNRSFYTILNSIVEKGKADGVFDHTYTNEDLTTFFVNNIRAVIYDWCLDDGNHDLEKSSQKHFKMIIDLINAKNTV